MFYQVFRIFFKGEAKSHSIEYHDNYDSALQRFFNVISADLSNQEVTYNAAYIIDGYGTMIRHEVFDRRQPEPEPEPENEPEEEIEQ